MPPRKKKTEDEFSLDKALGLLEAGLKNPKPNHFQYAPHEKQVAFHSSQTNGRQFLGGNRSGKTVAGINEDIYWLRGEHPYFRLPPPPIFGRIITVDFKNGAYQIIVPQLRQWIPPSLLINGSWEDSYNNHYHTLTLANGSQLEIMSHEQDLDKFAGVPRHFMHFDEEPPFDIFKECKARLTDYNGRWWMTMTPVEGMTWTYEEVWEKRNTNLITVVQVDSHENPHISKDGLENLLDGYDEDEKKIRGEGKYIAISGLVFKHFDWETHVIEQDGIPNATEYVHYVSLDAGYNNPTAVLWHAVHKRTGVVITYMEHYKREMTVEQHAEVIKEKNKWLLENFGIVPFLHIADPAIKQRQQTTGHSIQIEYALNGVNFALGSVRDVNAGLDKMNNYLRLKKWFITIQCPNFLKEMRKYKRGQYATSKLREKNNAKEDPQKKDDHACDSARYFFSFMPELNPKDPAPPDKVKPNLLGAPTVQRRERLDVFDTSLSQPQSVHVVSDEFIGEW